jgi:UDP-N-acetylmuramate: L-alanyl-gamma-D-glutamyl-meso-diaminopimelate ligase
VIDDFAHHPTAVRETLQGLKRMYDGRRLVAVFEPRTNTSRRSFFQQDYVGAFAAADLSLIRRVSEDKPIDADDCFSSEKLAEDLSRSGQQAAAFDDTDQILEYLGRISRPGDVIAILSNGGFDNIHERLLDRLSRKFSGDDQSR